MPGTLDTPASPSNLPRPRNTSRWRWATSRRAIVGGGVLAVVLGLGGAGAGASTATSTPTSATGHAGPPSGPARPTTAGKITALSGDTITIHTRHGTSQSVTYSSTTTFDAGSGNSSSAGLAIGDFVAVQGATNSDGSVTATNIMISPQPPGPMGKGRTGQAGRMPALNQNASTG
jgi:hypothetical protein